MTVNIDSFPLVLCGPILRRVTPRSVSVFVALKEARFIDLTIHKDAADQISSYTTVPIHTISGYAGSVADIPNTVALGKYLHVAVVTLEIPLIADELAPGILYGYNLRFYKSAQSALDHTATDPSSSEIVSLAQTDFDLLTPQRERDDGSVHYPFGYESNRLPSFSLPPKDFEQFNLVHGSCRKPHGEGDDMLAALDDLMVNGNLYNDANLRPHLLLLTGDQIYADDVSPPLLRTLHDVAQALLGWDEVFYGTGAISGGFYDEIDAVRQAAQAIIDAGSGITEMALKELLDGLAEAIDAIAASGSSFQSQIIRLIANQVRAFGAAMQALRQDTATFSLSVAQVMAGTIKGWIDDHSPIFSNMASNHHWGQTETEERGYIASRISPPQREKELKEFAALTSDAMIAHLMFLGEFYMMYLFTWSDVLWRKDKEIKDDDGNAINTIPNAICLPEYDDAVPNYGWLGELSKSSLENTRKETEKFAKTLGKVRRVLANIPTLMIFDDHEVTDDWNLNEDWVRKVNGSIMGPSVLRNALAACAIFQDWGNQPADYRTGAKGKKILDALTVAIDGDAVSPPAVAAAKNGQEEEPSDVLFDTFGIGPVVANAFGSDLAETINETGETISETINGVLAHDHEEDVFYVAPAPLKKWDWVYDPYPDAPFVQVICLDTRTRRGYPTKRWSLRYELPIKDLLEGNSDNDDSEPIVDGRVAPVALIHRAELDRQLRPLPPATGTDPPARLSDQKLNIVISPAPVFGLPLLEDFFQRYLVLSSGPEVADYEAWQGNTTAFDALVKRLKGRNVVLLSGDVHYAYSNQIEFVGSTDDAPYRLIQFCSTSMKNETRMTRVLGRAGRNGRSLDFSLLNLNRFFDVVPDIWGDLVDSFSDFTSFLEWFAATAPILPVKVETDPFNVAYNPEAHITHYLALKDNLLFSFDLLLPNALLAMGDSMRAYIWDQLFPPDEPEKGYSVYFLKDRRGKPQRALDAEQFNQDFDTEPYLEHLSEMPEVVGYNNFGRLTFRSALDDPTTFKDVTHHLFWQIHDERSEPLSYLSSTRHERLNRWGIFKVVFADQALLQLRRWRPPYKDAIREEEEDGRKILRGYYDYMKPEWTDKGISQPDDGELSARAWSALFVSYCAKIAGTDDAFEYSPGHIFYMRAAAENRKNKEADKPFWLYALDEVEPEIGDIVCAWRNNPYSYSDVVADLDLDAPDRPARPSHCEIIVGKTAAELQTVGGNVTLPGGDSGLGVTVGRHSVPLVDGKISTENGCNIIAVIRVCTDLDSLE